MTVNHESGDIGGEVLEGRFTGITLDQLQREQLLELLRECRDDEESVAMLEACLDRVHGDDCRDRTNERDRQQATGNAGTMSRDEALQVLGLSPDPTEEEILQAHRRLMKNMHPDRGGSDYLAAKINLAKETLLAK